MHTRNHFTWIPFALLLLGFPLGLRAVDVVPFTLPVGYSFKITSNCGGILQIYDGATLGVGLAPGAGSESGVEFAQMAPGKEYDMLFQGSGPNGWDFNLSL